MPFSPHSAAPHIEAHQIQLDVTANEATNILDKSVHGLLEKALTSDDLLLTATEAEQSGYIRATGAFSANRTLTLPDNNDAGDGPRPKHFVLEHAGTGGFSLTLTTVDGTGVTLSQDTVQAVYVDGQDVVAVAAATGAGGGPYDIVFQKDGLPGDGAVLYTHLPTRSFTLPEDFVGSRFVLTVAPSDGDIEFSVRKNGVEIGTIEFADTETDATFTATETTFTSTDIFTLVAPSPQDTTASDLAGTLKGRAS